MRFLSVVALLPLVALPLVLSACQPLPHPFEDQMPPPNSDLMTPPDSAGVVVQPITGAPDASAHALADAMATALQDNDVPASTAARNRGSYSLQGAATTKDLGGGKLNVTIAWEMHGPDGTVSGQQQSSGTVAQDDWTQGHAALAGLATPAAPALAKLIETKAPPPVAGAGDPLIAVHLAKGAPGDGGQALATAMSAALRRSQVSMADFPGAVPNFVVEVQVAITPPAAGHQKVSIAWSLHGADGAQIGEVKQENAVDAGTLDRVWGLTAYDAANAAAPGITALIDEAKRAALRS